MSHDSSHIYKDAPYGISTDDVSYVLGETSGDVGTLCTSNSINKYAKYKPCGGSSPASPTEAERKQVNCGIDTTNLVFSSFGDCLTAAKANCDWSKVTPVSYRLADFDKYYHGARQPYYGQIDIVGNTIIGGTSGMYIQLAIQHNNDTFDGVKVNMQLSDLLGVLEENYSLDQYRYAFVYRDASSASAPIYSVDIPLSSGETIADANNKFINVTFAMPSGSTYQSVVTYDCVFVAYAYDEGVGDVFFLPKSYFQVKLALFGIWNSSGVSIENTTIQIPQTGATVPLIFSGYEWNALVMGNLVPASFNPASGDSQNNYKNVNMVVAANTERRIEQKVSALVYVSAPGRVGTTGDFTKEFTIEQACLAPVSERNIEIWYDDGSGYDKVNALYIPSGGGVQKNFDIKYDTDWRVKRIYDADTEQEVTGLQFSPTSRPAPNPNPGWATFYDAYILSTAALPAGKEYRIEFETTETDPDDRHYIGDFSVFTQAI